VNTPYTVRLKEVFHGPMDLLLHLVKEQEVEIHEVEITKVIEGYLAYVKDLRDLDIELAGEFLVIAATLMAIKSRSLLPRDEVDLEDDLDPRDELIQRLIEYRRFKEAADDLGDRFGERTRMHPRGTHVEVEGSQPEPTPDLGELTSWDLLAAFSRLMRETLANRPHHVRSDPRPLRFYVQRLAHEIRARGRLTLTEVVDQDEHPTRETLIGAFCALLELVRMGLVGVDQAEEGGEIGLVLRAEHAEDIESVVAASTFDDEVQEAADQGGEPQAPAAEAEHVPAPAGETNRARGASERSES
jgi:segregation and condensation protein A